jgi:RNA polymerase sigma-70 factor (ECF subfamily)
MRNLTFTDVERLAECADGTDVVLQMDEEAFAAFYERTARSIWAYLSRLTGDAQAADDLLQETYYRFLRADRRFESDAHRRNYLYRIATNLARDSRRRPHVDFVRVPDEDEPGVLRADDNVAERTICRADLARAMKRLRPRDRAMLWLAYAHGSSHHEIAESLGMKRTSIKLLLFRARRRLAALLRGEG